ncbi:hypothetical protein VAR608DRAFT_1250 [Variovorax sp. HW608]|uniref:DUF2325 domain-containing protein n=1 Tax=Variovorax sp. HW608 TaxID=1034889 RepID=UPI000820126C|nr:DUF2325 domain-containing protein [Variovorax sp. HW608]SCK17775.1 hypothetical protein VAR608DRAFT_1250 [Variovorax sp. HW608]
MKAVASADAAARLDRAEAHIAALHEELRSLEEALPELIGGAGRADAGWLAALRNKRIVYVGGHPGSNAVLRTLVQAAGGRFILHAGLVDDDERPRHGEGRRVGFEALLPEADWVFCPLNLIDSDSLAALRRLCARYGVPWRALRTASIGSFVSGVLTQRPMHGPAPQRSLPGGPRACPRHGH